MEGQGWQQQAATALGLQQQTPLRWTSSRDAWRSCVGRSDGRRGSRGRGRRKGSGARGAGEHGREGRGAEKEEEEEEGGGGSMGGKGVGLRRSE